MPIVQEVDMERLMKIIHRKIDAYPESENEKTFYCGALLCDDGAWRVREVEYGAEMEKGELIITVTGKEL